MGPPRTQHAYVQKRWAQLDSAGWSGEEAGALKTKLSKLEKDSPPFANEVKKPGRWSKRRPGTERWVEPRLVAEIEFAEWTSEGQIRHASYIGLRGDKSAKSITR